MDALKPVDDCVRLSLTLFAPSASPKAKFSLTPALIDGVIDTRALRSDNLAFNSEIRARITS